MHKMGSIEFKSTKKCVFIWEITGLKCINASLSGNIEVKVRF